MLETRLRESRVRLPATTQLCFCSLIFVDYVLILYDYQVAFSPICSVVYALGLVRLISRCYAVLYAPQSTVCPCPVCRSCSDSPSSLLALFLPASRCFTGHRSVHVAPLCAYRPATSGFRISSSSCYRASFLTDNTSGIYVHRFIRHAVDNSRVIAGYSLNFP
jgi:hypothetical protein